MTQQEFDNRMADINLRQSDATAPYRERLTELNDRALQIKVTISSLNLELSQLALERSSLEHQLKLQNRGYHEEKHRLNIQWREEIDSK